MDSFAHYQRHDLVWLSDTAWQGLVLPTDLQVRLGLWQQEEWPAVVTRRQPDAAYDEVCIGFPLPPLDGNKPRFAARVKLDDIAIHQPSLSLHSVIMTAPAVWQADLQNLHQEALLAGIKLRVYGSLSMQFLTGQAYLHAASDIDILFRPYHQAQLRVGLALLQQYSQLIPLDGEIIFPDEMAVAWKEWTQCPGEATDYLQQRVMVKSLQGVSLRTRQELLQHLPEGALPC